jgi:hypothetical protein
MDDIVDRLRSEHYHIDRDGFDCISCEAADEIERLRVALAFMVEWRNRTVNGIVVPNIRRGR